MKLWSQRTKIFAYPPRNLLTSSFPAAPTTRSPSSSFLAISRSCWWTRRSPAAARASYRPWSQENVTSPTLPTCTMRLSGGISWTSWTGLINHWIMQIHRGGEAWIFSWKDILCLGLLYGLKYFGFKKQTLKNLFDKVHHNIFVFLT